MTQRNHFRGYSGHNFLSLFFYRADKFPAAVLVFGILDIGGSNPGDPFTGNLIDS